MALKDFVKSLPLDAISEDLSGLVAWWINLVKDVPDDKLPLYAYVGMSAIVLVLWYFVARLLPKPLGMMSWVIVAAVLFTPSTSLGNSGEPAPAAIAMVYGFLMGDTAGAMSALLSIIGMILGGFILIGVWQFLRAGIESHLQKSKKEKLIAEHTGNI